MERIGIATEYSVELDLSHADLYEIVDYVIPICKKIVDDAGLTEEQVLVSGFFQTERQFYDKEFDELFLTDLQLLSDPDQIHNPIRYAVEESSFGDRKYVRLYDRERLERSGVVEPRQDFYVYSSNIGSQSKEIAGAHDLVAQIEIKHRDK